MTRIEQTINTRRRRVAGSRFEDIMKNTARQVWISWIASLLFLAAGITSAPASLITESATTGLKPTDFTATLELGLFDPSLGQLHEVHITITGELIGGAEYENGNATTSKSGSLKYTLNQTLEVVHGVQTLFEMSDVTTKAVTVPVLAKFDGTLDFAGKSGKKIQGIDDTVSKEYDYAANADLSQYIGKGTAEFKVNTDTLASLVASVPTGVHFDTYSLADLTVAIRYNYSPLRATENSGDATHEDSHTAHESDESLSSVAAVPEPGTGHLLALGGIGVLIWRRRRAGSL